MARLRLEEQIQSAIIDYIATVAPGVLVYAVPNASKRSENGRAANAVPGLTKGVPDLALVLPGARAAFIEVKTERGKMRKEQTAMRLRMIRLGIPACTAKSVDDVRVFLENNGVLTREAKRAA